MFEFLNFGILGIVCLSDMLQFFLYYYCFIMIIFKGLISFMVFMVNKVIKNAIEILGYFLYKGD